MKKFIFYFITASLLFFASCEEKKSDGAPKIDNIAFSADKYSCGEVVKMLIHVSDAEQPLSTIRIKAILGKYLVSDERVRTYGTSFTVNHEITVPFMLELENTPMNFILELENIEGVKVIGNASINIVRPEFPLLYLMLSDGSIKVMKPDAANSDLYSVATNIVRNARVRIFDRLDESRFNWGWNGKSVQLNETELIPLNNSKQGMYNITFNTFNFTISTFLQ
jgi:hypothetical protein